MAMILQHQRQPVGMGGVGRTLRVNGGAEELDIVLHQHPRSGLAMYALPKETQSARPSTIAALARRLS
jgi:hypothetical protein